MKKYIETLRDYCKQNPLNHGDAESVMEFLYWHYAEFNPIDNQKIRDSFAKLRRQFRTCPWRNLTPSSQRSVTSALSMSTLPFWKVSVWA